MSTAGEATGTTEATETIPAESGQIPENSTVNRRQGFGAAPQFGKIRRVPRLLHHCIPRQFGQLPAAQRAAEKVRGDVRQLVRLVENDGFHARQQLGEPGFPQRQVGAEQVMVNH